MIEGYTYFKVQNKTILPNKSTKADPRTKTKRMHLREQKINKRFFKIMEYIHKVAGTKCESLNSKSSGFMLVSKKDLIKK